jgi:hypothetical protein
VAGDGGQLFEGNGLSWTPITGLGARENLRAITGAPGSRVVGGWFATVLDESTSWGVSHTGTRLYGVHAPPEGNPMVVGQGGIGFERRSGVWQRVVIPNAASLFDIAGPSANDRLAVGDSGSVLHYNGSTWTSEQVPADGLLRSVWYDGTHALVVGADGVVLVREGGAWRAINSGTTRFLRHVGGKRWDQLYVAGDTGTLMRWDGSTLRRITVPTEQNLRGTWVENPRDVWVVGDAGTLLRFDGWGWRRQFSPTLNNMRAIHVVDDVLYIAGDFGQIWGNDGTDWRAITVNHTGLWLQMGGTDELIVVGEVGTIAEGAR